MEKKPLPKAVQVFRKLRERGYYYVDKTAYIDLLMQEENTNIFLSRPRRFGKSLFVSTLREAFECNESLFEGLALHGKWDWSSPHPVIHISLASGDYLSPGGLTSALNARLRSAERRAGIGSSESHPSSRLFELIESLHIQTGMEVVLLVDEYDKPILDAIRHPDIAIANRDQLASFYGVIKDVPDMVRFSFFTGVSRFAKTSLFSGMNNLEDITIDSKYSAICGYAESDLDNVFAPELNGLNREKIREWYNGYSWLGEKKVYSPYDILYLFSKRKFEHWWFKTGATRFLIDTLRENAVMSVDLDRMRPRGSLLESFDVDRIEPEALLFQTGYLTIAEEIDDGGEARYKLDYPNREVREGLNQLMLEILLPGASEGLLEERKELLRCLLECDVEGMKILFQRVLAGLPKQLHARVDLTQYEAYFESSLYSYFMGVGLVVRAEDPTSRGRIDLVVEGPSYVYIFELKMVGDEETGEAMKQLLKMEYSQKYRGMGKSLYLAGIEISRGTRNIVGFEIVEDASGNL